MSVKVLNGCSICDCVVLSVIANNCEKMKLQLQSQCVFGDYQTRNIVTLIAVIKTNKINREHCFYVL